MSTTEEIVRADLKPDAIEEHEYDPTMVKVTVDVERGQVGKLMAFMNDNSWEKAQAIRSEELKVCAKSLEWCVNIALNEHYSTAEAIARFLASLYNGQRVQADVSRISNFDHKHFQHLMNVLRLCFETHREPHTFFKDGNAIFERIIERFGFEKKKRGSRS